MPTQRPGLRTPITGKIIWVRVDTRASGETTESKKPAATNGLLKALGAFGAHALRAMVDASALATWHTAVLYQLLHGLGLKGLADSKTAAADLAFNRIKQRYRIFTPT